MPMVRCATCKNEYFVETMSGEPCFICKYNRENKKAPERPMSRIQEERRNKRKMRRV